MISLLSSLAFADAAAEMDMAPCMEAYVVATLPAAGATGVPLDTAPALVWADDCQMGGGSFRMLLERDGELVAEQRLDTPAASGGVGRMDLDEALDPDTEYLLTIEDDWNVVEVQFTTGDALAGEPGQPTVTDMTLSAWDNGQDFTISGNVSVQQGEDADGMGLLVVRDEEGQVLGASANAQAWIWISERAAAVPDELCVDVSQENAAGQAGEPVSACAVPELEQSTGCSTGPLSMSLSATLFGLALAMRRRS